MKLRNNGYSGFRGSFRRLNPKESDGELIILCLLPVCGLFLAIWLYFGLPLPKCLINQWTGIPCITCGATRALGAMGRGDWLQALYWNPGVVFSGIFMGAVWIYSVATCVFRLPRFRPAVSPRWQNVIRALIFLLLLANWLYLTLTLP